MEHFKNKLRINKINKYAMFIYRFGISLLSIRGTIRKHPIAI
jgi:hypothetical protein